MNDEDEPINWGFENPETFKSANPYGLDTEEMIVFIVNDCCIPAVRKLAVCVWGLNKCKNLRIIKKKWICFIV